MPLNYRADICDHSRAIVFMSKQPQTPLQTMPPSLQYR